MEDAGRGKPVWGTGNRSTARGWSRGIAGFPIMCLTIKQRKHLLLFRHLVSEYVHKQERAGTMNVEHFTEKARQAISDAARISLPRCLTKMAGWCSR